MAQEKKPIIEIEDLQPKDTLAGYRATWQERGLIAYAELVPIDDQPARGFILECGYNTASGREPGNRQIDTGTTLTSCVRSYMLEAMRGAGWEEIGREASGRPIWQHASRIAAVAPAGAQDQDGALYHQKTLLVPAREQVKSYSRTITASEVTYTCARCRREVSKVVYPGAAPQYCDDCAKEVTREKTRARVARLRAGKRGGQAQTS